MKKLIFLLIILTTFSSCHFPSYRHSGNVNSSLDFRKGKWLLNNIESPKEINYVLTKIAREKFSKILGKRFSTLNEAKNILVPQLKNKDSFNKSILKDIKNGTDFDYFINIRANTNKSEIGDVQIGPVYSRLENNVEISIEIYDLNLLERFYFHTVVGNLTIDENNQDFAFTKSVEKLTRKGFEKIMKKIKRNERRN